MSVRRLQCFLIRPARHRSSQAAPSLHWRLASTEAKSASRVDRISSRLPRFLQRYTTPLKNAPVSHISAFLLLHEVTAVVPLLGFAGAFHYYGWLPPFISEWKYFSDGLEKFGNYFRRKGWLGDDDASMNKWSRRGEGGARLVVEFATAWALTKALLPLRLIVSVWGTPWFARVFVIPATNGFKRLIGRSPKSKPSAAAVAKNASAAAGTGATGGGVLPTNPK